MASPNDVLVVYSTFPSPEKAAEIIRTLVEEGLAACGNIIPAVRSIYRWQGAVHDDSESLAIIKTARARFDDLARRLVQLHPYELPEAIAVPVAAGHPPYLTWVTGE